MTPILYGPYRTGYTHFFRVGHFVKNSESFTISILLMKVTKDNTTYCHDRSCAKKVFVMKGKVERTRHAFCLKARRKSTLVVP